MDPILERLIEIARFAGADILRIYEHEEIEVQNKEDESPLTQADNAAHQAITTGLKESFPEEHIISEEGPSFDIKVRQNWRSFWLVDPLDGTKEFINKNGEFTVNIARITDKKPDMGVVFAPALGLMYYGAVGEGAWKQQGTGEPQSLPVHPLDKQPKRAMRSRSHQKPEEEEMLNHLGVEDTVIAGSSLKFAQVAEGLAEVYYRHGNTMEWDTAAGEAVILAAGGAVLTPEGPLSYNKEDLKNPSFLCVGPGVQLEAKDVPGW
jgi:3'(2'), 5'-bisphosphate nucleotidase